LNYADQPTLPRPERPQLVHAFDVVALLQPAIRHGATPLGKRARVPIIGGTVRGPDIEGRVVPGGADWQLLRADNYLELEASYFIETNDGVSIHIHNRGLIHVPTVEEPFGYALTTPRFEAPLGRYDWLNRHIFVGTIVPDDPAAPSFVQISIYALN
jgi:hypothetical protein